jgi:hypothetical protein
MQNFEIIINEVGYRNYSRSKRLLDFFQKQYNAKLIRKVDFGPFEFEEEKWLYYYGKPIKGYLIQIGNCYFEDIVKDFFSNGTVIWNYSPLDIYNRGDWSINSIMLQKKKIYFNKIIRIKKYQKLFSTIDNVFTVNNPDVWKYFLSQPNLYEVNELSKYREFFTPELLTTINSCGNFRMEDIEQHSNILIARDFSLNKIVIKKFFILIEKGIRIDFGRLSYNSFITAEFLIEFSEFCRNNRMLTRDFRWYIAIENCVLQNEVYERLENLMEWRSELIPQLLSKTNSIDVFKKYFRKLTVENYKKSLTHNIVWDIELFEMLLDLVNRNGNRNYRFLSDVLERILISKEVLTEYAKILNGGFSYSKKVYSSWSEGSIYWDTSVYLGDLIVPHEDLSGNVIKTTLENSGPYLAL